MWMSVLWITEVAVHTLTAPTHLETLPVPVLAGISATDSTARVNSPRADSHKRLIFRVICKYNIGLMFFSTSWVCGLMISKHYPKIKVSESHITELFLTWPLVQIRLCQFHHKNITFAIYRLYNQHGGTKHGVCDAQMHSYKNYTFRVKRGVARVTWPTF